MYFPVNARHFIHPYSAEINFLVQTLKSDVCRRQILTYKDGPRSTERVNIFWS